jgi:putative peptidoglycan lipid II flippase
MRWRYLRRAGLLQPQPGWGAFSLRLLGACAVMAGTVIALRLWIGDWTGIASVQQRVLWLAVAIGGGALAYAVTLLALGLRPRHLRH